MGRSGSEAAGGPTLSRQSWGGVDEGESGNCSQHPHWIAQPHVIGLWLHRESQGYKDSSHPPPNSRSHCPSDVRSHAIVPALYGCCFSCMIAFQFQSELLS